MSELNFPNQKLQQYTKLSTEPGMTHCVPKIWNNKPIESELPDNGEEDDPQFPHSDGTYNTYSPKSAP